MFTLPITRSAAAAIGSLLIVIFYDIYVQTSCAAAVCSWLEFTRNLAALLQYISKFHSAEIDSDSFLVAFVMSRPIAGQGYLINIFKL